MLKFIKIAAVLCSVALLAACGSGGGDGSSSTSTSSVPTDPNLTFQLFPAGAFSAGYAETYQLSGSDTLGGTYTATLAITTQSQTTAFNNGWLIGQPAIPVHEGIRITNTQTQASKLMTGIYYYSTDTGSLILLGLANERANPYSINVITPASVHVIPQSGKIGDSGTIGTYTGYDGRIVKLSWELADATNGLANLIILATTRYYGILRSSVEQSFVIDQSGNRKSLTLKAELPRYVASLTLSGNKQ